MRSTAPPAAGRPLLDPVVLAGIGDLALVARRTVEGSVTGLHRSPFHGYSAEFSQYRPGDDLKYVDWKLLARTDRIYTRQYRETTNVAAQICLDTSGSMAFQGAAGVAKADYARLLAAALAQLLASQGDAVGLVAFNDRVGPWLPGRAGPAHLRALLLALARIAPAGRTSTPPALRRGIDLMRRRGVLIVIGDLYEDDDEVGRELRRAARIGHEVVIFHVLTREEVQFPYAGDVELEDLETGARLHAGGGEAADPYREAVAAFLDRWRTRCVREGMDYTLALTHEPLDRVLRGWLVRRGRGGAR
jgi:uncharacterized protein (DUF58 family)